MSNRTSLGRVLSAADDAPELDLFAGERRWSRSLPATPPSSVNRLRADQALTFRRREPSALRGLEQRRRPSAIADHHVVYGGPPLDRLSSTTVNILGRVASGVSAAQAETELGAAALASGADRLEPSEPAAEFSAAPTRDSDRARAPEEELTGVRFEPFAVQRNASAIALVVAIAMTVIALVLLLACGQRRQLPAGQRDRAPARDRCTARALARVEDESGASS